MGIPVDWFDIHAAAVQAGSSVVIAVLTIALVWVTHRYADVVKQQRFDLSRPVIHPSGAPPLTESGDIDWNKSRCELQLRNIGNGIALIVCGVIFPPEPKDQVGILPARYTLWREPTIPMEPDDRAYKFQQGVTKIPGEAKIGPHTLFAPSRSTPRRPTRAESMLHGRYNTLARLTLTYEDIFRHKHAALFDYIDLYGWQSIGLISDISTSLEELDRKTDWSSSVES